MFKNYQLPFSDRDNSSIQFIIIHCCAYSVNKAIDSFKEADVSAHYIISPNGKIISLVDDKNCAWHAGKSFWDGKVSLNKFSIGIELSSHSLGQNKYPEKQIVSLINLLKKLQKKYHIPSSNILGHSDIAPDRKPDPGKAFPWKKLAKHKLGIWYNLNEAKNILSDNPQKLLSFIGYDTTNMTAALSAFCRHFYPSKIKKYSNIFELLNNPIEQNITVDKRLLKRLQAVAYAYAKASKKPCKI